MSTQISLQLTDKMLASVKDYSESHGFNSVQDFIREVIREKLFEGEDGKLSGVYTYLASEKALAKKWLTKEEDKAWAHLQKQT